MNNLQIFRNEEFGQIRTVAMDGEPWFVGKDVAEALGYGNTRDALSKHIDAEDKGVAKYDTPGGVQNLSIINESGLYSLILSSKLPNAKKFKRWVTADVLPSIRKTGRYEQQLPQGKELLAMAVIEAQKTIEEQTNQIETMKPKALFADAVSSSKTSILIGDLAKLLRQNGVQIGQNRLFQWLRNKKYLGSRKGDSWNMPTQKSMDMGLFEIKEHTHIDGNGCNITTRTPDQIKLAESKKTYTKKPYDKMAFRWI